LICKISSLESKKGFQAKSLKTLVIKWLGDKDSNLN